MAPKEPEPKPEPKLELEPKPEPKILESKVISDPQPPKRSYTRLAVSLDLLGAAIVGFGVWQDIEVGRLHKEYMALSKSAKVYGFSVRCVKD